MSHLLRTSIRKLCAVWRGSRRDEMKDSAPTAGADRQGGQALSRRIRRPSAAPPWGKRLIAGSGRWVDMDEAGNIRADGRLPEKALGQGGSGLPYLVPAGKIFVLGDHRSTSVDSRGTAVGCISGADIGKTMFRTWPLAGPGPVK